MHGDNTSIDYSLIWNMIKQFNHIGKILSSEENDLNTNKKQNDITCTRDQTTEFHQREDKKLKGVENEG